MTESEDDQVVEGTDLLCHLVGGADEALTGSIVHGDIRRARVDVMGRW